MPTLPPSLHNPGLILALCLIIGLVVGVNATLLSLFRRGAARRDGGAGTWSRALSGARERGQQQAAQLDELHRAVSALARDAPKADEPHE